ncbi:MAG: bifunctional diaminohydroxyphosphoribosylaminopyrimidine deaminase/5-amino-6-(5-phosphoribosylamino)uracil reductase RibD [Bacillota bacterium]|nr:bifunctional diaminohydroxyphosphoribosylaminopyrimidine deaminase/5-amino-6-(5-phosphoribosylamino)uracil reductase RibD [Bacillota bacterium]
MHDEKPADERYMRLALRLAARGLGKTSPNPAVGAVVVSPGGRIVGQGYHRRAGLPHAEVEALTAAGSEARGATLYVNLEPCAHHGRTPPCAEAIIKAGVAKVHFAIHDPNPLVSGRGERLLREAGIEVKVGLLAAEAARLNEAFLKHVVTGMPFVILKFAMTLDGKIATVTGDSKWVTGEEARRYVHRLRSRVDAVMVGIGTVLSDDPLLTPRLTDYAPTRLLRVIVDSRARTPLTARVLSAGLEPPLIAVTAETPADRTERLRQTGARVAVLPQDAQGRVDLAALFSHLGRQGITSVLLEGGGEIAASALQARLVDKVLCFVAPKIAGGDGPSPVRGRGVSLMSEAVRLTPFRIRRFGEDLLLECYVPGSAGEEGEQCLQAWWKR